MDGKQLRLMRAWRAMTQAELENATGIDAAIISKIEGGYVLPTPEIEAAIREALAWPDNADEAFALLETAN